MNDILENSTALHIETHEVVVNLKSFLEEKNDNILLKFKDRFVASSRSYLLENVKFCGLLISILGVINLYKNDYDNFKDSNNNIFEIFKENFVLFNIYTMKTYKRIPSNNESALIIYKAIIKHTNLLKPQTFHYEDVDLTIGINN